MTALNKKALREAAEKATPGDWRRASTRFNGITATPFSLGGEEVMLAGTSEKRDAEFIAAANPATVLSLLDELEVAEKRIAELEALTVNLPKRNVGEVMHMSGFSRDYAEGWCAGNDNAIHEIRAAGIGVKGE